MTIKEAILKINDEINAREPEITAYDQEIGDGDHALNLQRGFNAIVKDLDNAPDEVSELFVYIGKTLMNVVGGTSGAIYGMGFMAGAIATKGKVWDFSSLISMIAVAAERITLAGGAQIGDKTLYDVWGNVKDHKDEITSAEILKTKLVEYMNSTKELSAHKGRASYIGDRSIGVVDPGAVTSEIILRTLADTI